MAAASQGHLDTVELLLRAKADPSAADRASLTALDHAQRSGKHQPCADLLAQHAQCRFHETAASASSAESSPQIQAYAAKLDLGTAVYPACFCGLEDHGMCKELSLLPFQFYPNEGPRHGVWRYTPKWPLGCSTEEEALKLSGQTLLIQVVQELCRLLRMELRRVWVLRYPNGGAYIGPHSDALTEQEDIGATVSLGASRVLRWQSNKGKGEAYRREVPMHNGHVVCFTQTVNEAFQHSVLAAREQDEAAQGERVVVVVWGRRGRRDAPFPEALAPAGLLRPAAGPAKREAH